MTPSKPVDPPPPAEQTGYCWQCRRNVRVPDIENNGCPRCGIRLMRAQAVVPLLFPNRLGPAPAPAPSQAGQTIRRGLRQPRALGGVSPRKRTPKDPHPLR